jgi:hypothetical protein
MTDDSETIALRATVIGGDHLRAFLYLIRNSFLFLKWNRRFDSRAFTASTTLWATGAGEFHKHSIFTRRPQGENVCGLFNLVDADTETAFGGYRQPPIPVIAFPSRRIPYLETCQNRMSE